MKNKAEVICTQSCDDLTKFLRTILKKYKSSHSQVNFFDFGTQSISFDKFAMANSIPKNAMVAFGGHGSSNALFINKQNSNVDFIFYDERYFDFGPRLLIAFSCLAGVNLGNQFTKKTGGSFFGYNCYIDFIDKSEYHQFWEDIIHSIIEIIFAEGEVNNYVLERIKDLYREVIRFFDSDQGSTYEYARFMRMFLLEQLEGIYE